MTPQTMGEVVDYLDGTEGDTADLYGTLAPLYEFVIEYRGVPEEQFRTVTATLPGDTTSVVEYACGMGSLVAGLETQYDEVVGLDRSRELLTLAREKSGADLVAGDARQPVFAERFDAAVMLGHSLGHLTGDGDVRKYFDAVAEALVPGGVLFFDCHERSAYADPGGRENVADGDRFHVTHEGDLSAADETGLVERTDTFTIRDHDTDRTVTVATEPYTFRTYEQDALAEALHAAGFDVADSRSRDTGIHVLAQRT